MSKIILLEAEKKLITALHHPLYTVEFVEEWVNYQGNVFINALASLQSMGAIGFYQAVKSMIRMGYDK